MGFTLGGISADEIHTIRTNGTHYTEIRNLREIVDRHIAYLAFEHDMVVLIPDKGKMKQEITVRVQIANIVAIEANKGEPVKVEEPF